MNFIDAVNNMGEGKKMNRKTWSGIYIMSLQGQSYIWEIGASNRNPTINANVYTPSIDDILADDWTVKN